MALGGAPASCQGPTEHLSEEMWFEFTPHLDRVGVVLRAPDHARGPVETRRGLEGDCEVVGLRDVLHGGGAGVRLHDGRELEWQHEREQLLEEERRRGRRNERKREREKERVRENESDVYMKVEIFDPCDSAKGEMKHKVRIDNRQSCIFTKTKNKCFL